MQAKHFHLFLVVAGMLTLLGLGLAQDPPPWGGGQGGPRGPFDPNMMFNFLSGGKDTVVIAEIPVNPRIPDAQQRLAEWAQRQGITNGQLTREQFAAFMQDILFNRLSGGKDTIVIAEVPANPRNPNAQQRMAEWAQRQGITNGQLTREQFAALMRERMAQRRADRGGGPPQGPPAGGPGFQLPEPATILTVPAPVEEDRRPTVYRIGKLPRDLPSWFEQLDSDQDGQVGLYEWKAAGRPVSEFVTMDRNGDGFVTVEEALRYQKVLAQSGSRPGSSGRNALASAGPGPNRAAAGASSGPGQGFRQRRGGRRPEQP